MIQFSIDKISSFAPLMVSWVLKGPFDSGKGDFFALKCLCLVKKAKENGISNFLGNSLLFTRLVFCWCKFEAQFEVMFAESHWHFGQPSSSVE